MTFLNVRVPELQKYNQQTLEKFKSMMIDDTSVVYHGLDYISSLEEMTNAFDEDRLEFPYQFLTEVWEPFCKENSRLDVDTVKPRFSKVKRKDLVFMHILKSLSISYYLNDDVYRICTWIINEYGPNLCMTKTGPSLVLKCIRHYEKEPCRPRISFERFISTLVDRFYIDLQPYKSDLESSLATLFTPSIHKEIINKLY